MKSVLFLGVCLATLPAIGRTLSIDDILAKRVASDPQISADGSRIVYTITSADLTNDKFTSQLFLSAEPLPTPRALTTRPGETVEKPRFLRGGAAVSFLSDRDGGHGTQLFAMPLDVPGEATRITNLPGEVVDYAFAPDPNYIALIVKDAEPKASDPPAPIVIDRFQFKRDTEGYLGARHQHLYVIDPAHPQGVQLLTGPYDEALPVWSPDSRHLAFVSKRPADPAHATDPDRSDAWAISVIDPKPGAIPRTLTNFDGGDSNPGWDSPPAWSPDGKMIAYAHGGPRKLIEYGVRTLATIPAAGGAPTILTQSLDRNVSQPAWSPDGTQIRFIIEDDWHDDLATIPAAGGPVTRLSTPDRAVKAFSESKGGAFALLESHPETPDAIYRQTNLGGPALWRVSGDDNKWLDSVTLPARHSLRAISADGTEIHGFVLTPPGYIEGHKYPAILRIHGGPQEQMDVGFDLNLGYDLDPVTLAAQGYVVIAVNPRGSTGRGEAFATGIYADWFHKDVEDVLAAVDAAVRAGYADPDHLGVGGWSYGGMLTNAVIASTHRFRAATSGASIANILAGYGTDEYVRDYEAELGTPWAATQIWVKLSYPFLHADRITTPTLFMGGDADFNVPLLNGEQMYQALRSQNVPAQLIIYPGANHIFTRPGFIRDRAVRELAWYAKYLR